jgi:hypothetical protein
MGRSFATDDREAHFHLKPLRVPILKQGVFEEARNLASELPGWRVVAADDSGLVLHCERRASSLSGTSHVTITFEGPEGIPSTTVHVHSETTGGFPGFTSDRKVVLEFMKPFHRRVC